MPGYRLTRESITILKLTIGKMLQKSSRLRDLVLKKTLMPTGLRPSAQLVPAMLSKAEQALERYRKSSAAWDKEHGWGHVLGVALTEAQAWTMFSEGKHDEAVAHLRNIAQYERDHPMYYADILPRPSGEMLGDMLLQMDKPAEALEAYKQALELAPNRFDSLIGAKAAAARSGTWSCRRSTPEKSWQRAACSHQECKVHYTGGAGRSELHMSAMHFQLPSLCFFHISSVFPWSVAGLPCASLAISS